MISLASSRLASRPRRATGSILVALAFIAPALAALLLVLHIGARSGAGAARLTSRTSTQPLLIIRPHASTLAGTLAGGGALRGALAPSVPGANAMRLAVYLRSGTPLTAGSLTLTASMPGMNMAPIRAVLHARQGAFTGTIRLPMFGDYLATITLRTPEATYTGSIALSLPLPRP